MSKQILTERQAAKVLSDVLVDYPKYSKTLINLANRWSKGTSPKQLGASISDLYLKFGGNTKEEWWEYLLTKLKNGGDLTDSIKKIKVMLKMFKKSLNQVSDDVIYHWLIDLIRDKSFKGLDIQQKILKMVSKDKGCEYRTANAEEEARNIDGFICDKPVSVKPLSYKKQIQPLDLEKIDIPIIYYWIDKNNELQLEYDF